MAFKFFMTDFGLRMKTVSYLRIAQQVKAEDSGSFLQINGCVKNGQTNGTKRATPQI